MSRFLDLCLDPNQPDAIVRTVEAIKRVLGENDCHAADTALQNTLDLDLSGFALESLEPLRGLVGLQVLTLAGNAIRDLSPLPSLTALSRLDLHNNDISGRIF